MIRLFQSICKAESLECIYETRFISSIEALESLLEEYTTEDNAIPLLIIIGTFLSARHKDSESTEWIIERLKKRKACIVVLLSCILRKTSIEKLEINDRDTNFTYFFSHIMRKEMDQVVTRKDFKRCAEILKKSLKVLSPKR